MSGLVRMSENHRYKTSKDYEHLAEYYKSGKLRFYDNNNNEIEVYGPDLLLFYQSQEMAEYMMARAKEISDFLQDKWNDDYKASRQELQTILQILKDAGIEIVKDGE